MAVIGQDERSGWWQSDSALSGTEGGGLREALGDAECNHRAARRESRWGRAVGLVARSEALGL